MAIYKANTPKDLEHNGQRRRKRNTVECTTELSLAKHSQSVQNQRRQLYTRQAYLNKTQRKLCQEIHFF